MGSLSFSYTDDDELDRVLKGGAPPAGYPWPRSMSIRQKNGREVGVLVHEEAGSASARVVAVVVSEEASRRLFGRYSKLRSDFSPISAWTHVMTWRHFEQMSSETRRADLGGFEASWIGIIVAEALMLSDRPLGNLKLVACMATPSYALARTRALWPGESIESILTRYDQSQKLLRPGEGGATSKLRDALADVWKSLLAAGAGDAYELSYELRSVSKALLTLKRAREERSDEGKALSDIFSISEAEFLWRLSETPAEDRLRDFDRIVSKIDALPLSERAYRNELYFLAGYLASVAAGGAPSLGLADRLAPRFPQILSWAYAIGGVGEAVTWTSAFDGLGRLIARDLLRPFRIDDAPLSDFHLDEALVLVDRALQDPLVHLRIKQLRVLSVSVLSGVNIFVQYAEAVREVRQSQTPPRQEYNSGMPLSVLADALWPYLEKRMGRTSEIAKRGGKSRNTRKDMGLPFEGENK